MKFLLVLAFAAVAVALPHGQITSIKDLFQGKDNGRIIGGAPARPGQIPWQVAITYETSSNSHFCGGALISDQWVLTAAHCAQEAIRFRIQLGGVTLIDPEEGRVEVETTESFVHPDYNSWRHNDIALIKLREPIIFTDKIKSIQLPFRAQHVGADEEVTVSGWGLTSEESTSISNTLNLVQLRSISNSECADLSGSWNVIDATLCCRGAPGHGPCGGDSGGPLVSYDWLGNAYHVGVVSTVDQAGCAAGMPSGFARTQSFLDWIHEHTGIPILN